MHIRYLTRARRDTLTTADAFSAVDQYSLRVRVGAQCLNWARRDAGVIHALGAEVRHLQPGEGHEDADP
jgi:hypothetical protein